MKLFDAPLMPELLRVAQIKDTPELQDPAQAIIDGMQPHIGRILPGKRYAVAAGSRGIYNYSLYIKTVVDQIKAAGGTPYVIPAMGSHGGATAEGQLEVLKGYGITEETMGCELLSSMETVILGETPSGVPVPFDKNAASMDGIIMVNRVKPHTDFHATIESGVIKQMVVGLGKQKGASTVHRRGVYGLTDVFPEEGRLILSKMPILMGVALLENAYDRTARIEVMLPEQFYEREPQLLDEAKSLMPSLPTDRIDVLVLTEMGKNISGTGIDPNIVGRYLIRGVQDEPRPKVSRLVCLDLSDESHGNAIGVGIADVITKRLADKINWEHTYINTITSGFLERGFSPVVLESDNLAVETALNCAGRLVTKEDARVVIAKNTLDLSQLIVSRAVYDEIKYRDDIDYLGHFDWDIDENENLVRKVFR